MDSMSSGIPAPDDGVHPTGNPTGVSGSNDAATEYLGRQKPPPEPPGCAGGPGATSGTESKSGPALKADPSIIGPDGR